MKRAQIKTEIVKSRQKWMCLDVGDLWRRRKGSTMGEEGVKKQYHRNASYLSPNKCSSFAHLPEMRTNPTTTQITSMSHPFVF